MGLRTKKRGTQEYRFIDGALGHTLDKEREFCMSGIAQA